MIYTNFLTSFDSFLWLRTVSSIFWFSESSSYLFTVSPITNEYPSSVNKFSASITYLTSEKVQPIENSWKYTPPPGKYIFKWSSKFCSSLAKHGSFYCSSITKQMSFYCSSLPDSSSIYTSIFCGLYFCPLHTNFLLPLLFFNDSGYYNNFTSSSFLSRSSSSRRLVFPSLSSDNYLLFDGLFSQSMYYYCLGF